MISYARRFLGPIIQYDHENQSCLLETLLLYLKSSCNRQKTAESAYVHINTINYRIKRIEEIAGVDLKDPDARLNLHVGLEVYNTLTENERKSLFAPSIYQ